MTTGHPEAPTVPAWPEDAWDMLSPRLTDHRRERMLGVAAARTAWLRLVIQDVHDPHNVSACLRSAEAFGVQNCDIVNLSHKFKVSTTSRGAETWLHVHKWPTIDACAQNLKRRGYRIAAGYPGQHWPQLDQLPVDAPIAVVFGNEHAGLHEDWAPHIDLPFTIPMAGMVESLNISVSTAISLYTLGQSCLRGLGPERFVLNDAERGRLLNEWICRHTPNYERELRARRARLGPLP